jgi:hypothetical protein
MCRLYSGKVKEKHTEKKLPSNSSSTPNFITETRARHDYVIIDRDIWSAVAKTQTGHELTEFS